MHRIVARLLVLEESLPVLHVPFGKAPAIFLVLLVAVADGVAVIDREGRTAVLLVALVLIVADHDQHIELGTGVRLRHVLDRGARDVLARHQMLGRHHVGELGIGLLQKVAIGCRTAFLVAVLDIAVGLDKTLQRLVGGEQHGRVGCSEPEDNSSHRPFPSSRFPRRAYTRAWERPARTLSSSRAASLYATSAGSTIAAARTL